jgi:hypothetical protein
LRVVSRLSVGVEIDFIHAGLLRGAWFGVPRLSAQLDLAEFLHSQATPNTATFWDQRLDTITASAELKAKDMLAACFFPPT